MKARAEIEMPESCAKCMLSYPIPRFSRIIVACPLTGIGREIDRAEKSRQDECPLIPVDDTGKDKSDICGTTNLPCIRCNPGGCEHRRDGV
jgi:hypothetical protein